MVEHSPLFANPNFPGKGGGMRRVTFAQGCARNFPLLWRDALRPKGRRRRSPGGHRPRRAGFAARVDADETVGSTRRHPWRVPSGRRRGPDPRPRGTGVSDDKGGAGALDRMWRVSRWRRSAHHRLVRARSLRPVGIARPGEPVSGARNTLASEMAARHPNRGNSFTVQSPC